LEITLKVKLKTALVFPRVHPQHTRIGIALTENVRRQHFFKYKVCWPNKIGQF